MAAYQRHKEIAFAAPSKLAYVEELLHRHRRDRALLFTERNRTAYALSRRFLLPIITHQTKVSERTRILEDLGAGVYNALVTSKVLNEGVDLPAAERRHRHLRQRVGARARAAARPAPPQAGRQDRGSLRAGRERHDRGVHERAAPGGPCRRLTWCGCAARVPGLEGVSAAE